MPTIPSANPNFQRVAVPGTDTGYSHPAERKKGGIPMAFQITSPFDRRKVLLPHALVMHVNPANMNESHSKKVERFQTRGGWVEQHWGDNLMEISADGSTGAFVNLYTGLSSVLRQQSIAWDRFRDLYDIYHNNGAVHDPFGNVVLQGHVMLMYDRGTYLGHFTSFDVDETDDSPYAFALNWSFKVEFIILQMTPQQSGTVVRPSFQGLNAVSSGGG